MSAASSCCDRYCTPSMKRLMAESRSLAAFAGLDEVGQVLFQVPGMRFAGRRFHAELDVANLHLKGAYEIPER